MHLSSPSRSLGPRERSLAFAGGFARFIVVLIFSATPLAAANYAGAYFGTLNSGGGRWALHVKADNTAVYLASLPDRQSALRVPLTLNPNGSFTAATAEIVPQTVGAPSA